MTRGFAYLTLAALLPGAAFSQSGTRPSFEMADVHVSARSANPAARGGVIRGDQYELHDATMVDLITRAYGVAAADVVSGPSWLEVTRFDVVAKAPANATPESVKLMLQALLAERLKLVLHNDTRAMPAYVLTAGKHPLIKQSDDPGDGGCENDPSVHSAAINAGFSCHNVTMAAFAETLQTAPGAPLRSYLSNSPVVDETGLKGAWDFKIKWTGRGALALVGPDGISLFDAVDKQLGLKLELGKSQMPVIVVDSVNEKPTENLPGVSQKLPELPTEFDVADVRPSQLDHPEAVHFDPGGRFSVKGITLIALLQHAWDTGEYPGMIVGPKWLDTERFDVVAKGPSLDGPSGILREDDSFRLMLRGLFVNRFRMVIHNEVQPVAVYALVAVNPKLKKADPANRSGCRYAGAAPGGLASALLRTYVCQNATMALFADSLHGFDPGYTNHPVIDMSGIEGNWDFTVTFSGSRAFNKPGQGAHPQSASDPDGAVSLFDALEKQLGLKLEVQKHPMSVVVIDHIEQKPTDN